MNAIRSIVVISLGAFPLLAQEPTTPARPATPPAATPPAKATGTPSLRGRLNYKPVGRGAPAGRVDAGSRGDGDDVASLFVLAPDEVGQTSRAQPRLHWFQNRRAPLPCEISILDPQQPAPILRLRRPAAAGYQSLDLAAHGVSLAAGVDYQWVVALIRDPASRSRDIVSSGWIRRVPSRLEEGASAAAFAEAGFWYDAIDRLAAQLAARPGDRDLPRLRDDLLAQVGIPTLTSKAQD